MDLLRQHGIELVVDVRSTPYSRYVPQANRENLARTLESAGIAYRWMGEPLGGKPEGTVATMTSFVPARPFGREWMVCLTWLPRAARPSCAPRAIIASATGTSSSRPPFLTAVPSVLHIQPDGSLVDENQEPRQLALF